jgi:hypothetical protein
MSTLIDIIVFIGVLIKFFVIEYLAYVPIPLISPCDSEGKRHAVPEEVAMAIRLMSPPLVGAKRRWFLALSHS